MANPLNEADKATIDKALEDIKEAESQITRAEAAGIDVSDMKADVARLKDQLARIRAAYFPTGRRG